MAVAGITCSNDCSVQDVQADKEAGCPVSFVGVCHRPATAFFYRQTRLGSVQGLNLGFLICTQFEMPPNLIKKVASGMEQDSEFMSIESLC